MNTCIATRKAPATGRSFFSLSLFYRIRINSCATFNSQNSICYVQVRRMGGLTCRLQTLFRPATKHCTIIPPPISDEICHPVQSNPATGSEEVLNLYPIQGAARYLTVGNFASAGPVARTCRKCVPAQPVDATPSDMTSFSRGGVYGTRKTEQAFP